MQRRAALASLLLVACATERHVAAPSSAPARRPPKRAAPERERALLSRFPKLGAALPFVALAELPTPVVEEPELAARLGLGALWVKRDDLAADPYGGNKVRKLELFLGDALKERRSAVLTFGGVGSNHALATAVHARRVGLNAILLLLPQRKSASVRHHLLAATAHGAELHLARAIEERAAARPFEARSPYLIPTGGTAPLGDVGLVAAGFELAAQVAARELPEPDEIWVALGTAGTAAGIALGVAAAGLDTRVVCVRVSSPRYGSVAHLERVFSDTRDFLRARDPSFPDVRLDPERVRVIDDFAAPGYGIPSQRGRQARELMKAVAGLELDDTYTAKTFAALHAAAREGSGLRVLFWNSYDPRRIAPADADPRMLPAELRGFAL